LNGISSDGLKLLEAIVVIFNNSLRDEDNSDKYQASYVRSESNSSKCRCGNHSFLHTWELLTYSLTDKELEEFLKDWEIYLKKEV